MEYNWAINYKDVLEFKKKNKSHNELIRRYIREMAIAERAYYEGFKPAKEKVMFKEEIDDIEKVYEQAVVDTDQEIKQILPSLLHYMGEFYDLHSKRDIMTEKLEVLRTKLGKEKEDE